MQAAFKEILKQANKVIRILTKVTEQHPKMSEQIDLALYAAIKIEKTVQKYMESSMSNHPKFEPPINQYKIDRNDDSQDAFFTAAMQNIQNFKDSTFKLQRKINVLIAQQESRQVRKPPAQHSIYPVTNVIAQNMKKKKVKSRNDAHMSDQESSSNLSAIDASIVKLVKEIKMAIKNEDQNQISSQNQGQ